MFVYIDFLLHKWYNEIIVTSTTTKGEVVTRNNSTRDQKPKAAKNVWGRRGRTSLKSRDMSVWTRDSSRSSWDWIDPRVVRNDRFILQQELQSVNDVDDAPATSTGNEVNQAPYTTESEHFKVDMCVVVGGKYYSLRDVDSIERITKHRRSSGNGHSRIRNRVRLVA